MGQKTAWARREDGEEEWAIASAPRYKFDLRAKLQPAEQTAADAAKPRWAQVDQQRELQARQ